MKTEDQKLDDSGGAQAGLCPPECCNHALTYPASVCLGCGAAIYGKAFPTDNPPIQVTKEHWVVSTDDLLKITEALDEHPEGWEWPCACKECLSHG